MKKLLPLFLALFSSSLAFAQVTLGPSPYTQNFNSIAAGLPPGISVRSAATSSALGTSQAYAGAAVVWNNTTGAFKNFASATDLVSGSTSVQQNASTNRSLGIRQTGTLGDPGAAFVLQLANTTNLKDFKLSFKLQSLDISSPRVATWRVDYGFGASPVAFTAAPATGTLTTGGSTFTNNTITVDFGNSLNNKPSDVWIRIVTITASTGGGNRPSSAIDDLSLTYSEGVAPTPALAVSPASLSFGNQATGSSSTAQSYSLSYSDLDGSNVIATTSAPFAISKSVGGPFSSTLTYTAAELGGTSTTVYTQFSPVSIGAASGSITHTGGGITGPVSVSLSGTGVNQTPSALADSYSGSFGDVIAGNVAANDSDPQGLALTYTKLSDPASGSLTFNTDGTFSYQSLVGTAASQTFNYQVSNTLGLTATAAVTISLSEKPKIFISQYYEGASVNKWIELTNPTDAPINTASPQLKLGLYSISGDAGNIVISGNPIQSMNLNFIIPAKSSVLIGNTGNGTEVPYLTAASAVQTSNSVINFNGNDGLALLDAANNIVDAFGTGVNARDVSYVRNQDATAPAATFTAANWTRTTLATVQNAADLDDPDRLGIHVQPDLPDCVSPSSQPTTLTFNSVGTKTIGLSFTASPDAGEYLIIRSLNSSLTGIPADGTVYSAGNNLGGGIVAGRIVGTTFTDGNLPSGTTFYYFIYALNSISCDGGPKYLTLNPLAASQATDPLPVCQTPLTQAGNFQVSFSNYNVIQGTFTPASGVDEFLVLMSKDSTLSSLPLNQTSYTVGDSIGGGIVIKKGASGAFNRSGLSQNTDYYFYIFSVNSNCSSGPLYLTAAPLTGRQKTAAFNSNALNYYFGNLHSHSSYSDGNKDDTSKKPEDDYAFAKNSRNMDFLGLSEHNHTQAGMRLAYWQPGMIAARNATTSNFVALHGMEWGVISGGGHVLVYGVDSLIGWEPGEHQIYVPKNTYTGTTGLFNAINRHGLNAIATLAHPNTSDYNGIAATYNAFADSAVVGSALQSGPAFSTNVTYSDPASSMSYLGYYNRMLARGYHLGASVDHDNHNMTFGRHTRARLVIMAPALTENDLLDGMKKMRFYASEDSAAKISYTINGQPVGSIFTGNGLPQISVSGATTSPITSIHIISGRPGTGIIPDTLYSSTSSTLSHTDSTLTHLSTGYYYVDITEADGSRIITSPIWYTRNDSLKSEQVITFNTLPAKTYGDLDSDPVATSSNTTIPITYTSSNPTIASIVDNKIHILNAGTVSITASQAGNALYKPAISKTQTLVISPKAVLASADAKSKVYGSADPELTYTFAPALIGSDAFSGSLTREAGENTGFYVISQGTLALNNNYLLTIDTALLTITKKPILASAEPKQKVYGSADPELTYLVTPALVDGDAFSGALIRVPGENAGSYTISQGTLSLSSNYTLSVDSNLLTITQKGLLVKADDKTKVYNAPNPVFTASYEGFINGDDAAVLSSPVVFSTTATQASDAGTYPITASGASSLNYSISYSPGILTISSTGQTITFAALADKTFGDADFALTASGGASANPVIYTSSNTGIATISAGTVHIVGAGTTTITASQAGDANYTAAAPVSQILTVNKAAATITLSNLIYTFDGSPKSATATTIPANLAGVSLTYNGSVNPPSAIGTYSVLASLSNANYSSVPVSGSLVISPIPATVKVQHRNGDNQLNNNDGKPYLKLVNTGTNPVPYSELTARYWITPENYIGLGMWIDYAALGNNKVIMKYVALSQPRVKALGYIEYSFTASAGSLAANANSGEIQSRYANTDWSSFNETNDHSIGSGTTYVDNSKITLYRNRVLIWGTEPATESPVISLKPYSEAKNSGSNTISTYLDLRNEGNVQVDYNDILIRYWFTSDGTAPLNFWKDYAKIGNNAISGSFFSVNPVRTNANAYLELKVSPVSSTFHPLTATGNIQYRISKSDWSNFNQLNDHSYKTGSMSENSKITIYYKGNLVYGTEPAGGNGPLLNVQMPSQNELINLEGTSTGTMVYPNPSSGNFTLQLNDERNGALNVTIFNSIGTAIDTYSVDKKGNFSKDYQLALPKGTYYLVIKRKDGTEYRKILIN